MNESNGPALRRTQKKRPHSSTGSPSSGASMVKKPITGAAQVSEPPSKKVAGHPVSIDARGAGGGVTITLNLKPKNI